jgi:hypothetical protein
VEERGNIGSVFSSALFATITRWDIPVKNQDGRKFCNKASWQLVKGTIVFNYCVTDYVIVQRNKERTLKKKRREGTAVITNCQEFAGKVLLKNKDLKLLEI